MANLAPRKDKHATIRLPLPLYTRLKKEAQQEHRSVSAQIRHFIERSLKEA